MFGSLSVPSGRFARGTVLLDVTFCAKPNFGLWFLRFGAPRDLLTLTDANPILRQHVDCSSPFYDVHPGTRESHSAAACGSFKSFLQQDVHPGIRIPQRGSVWIVQVLSTTYTQVLANPTARQHVDCSSPFLRRTPRYSRNSTARQRVDRSSPV